MLGGPPSRGRGPDVMQAYKYAVCAKASRGPDVMQVYIYAIHVQMVRAQFNIHTSGMHETS